MAEQTSKDMLKPGRFTTRGSSFQQFLAYEVLLKKGAASAEQVAARSEGKAVKLAPALICCEMEL